jgi:hypothetical protein
MNDIIKKGQLVVIWDEPLKSDTFDAAIFDSKIFN